MRTRFMQREFFPFRSVYLFLFFYSFWFLEDASESLVKSILLNKTYFKFRNKDDFAMKDGIVFDGKYLVR